MKHSGSGTPAVNPMQSHALQHVPDSVPIRPLSRSGNQRETTGLSKKLARANNHTRFHFNGMRFARRIVERLTLIVEVLAVVSWTLLVRGR